MNYALQTKIMRALGFALGALSTLSLTSVSDAEKNRLISAENHLRKELDDIMKEFENVERR